MLKVKPRTSRELRDEYNGKYKNGVTISEISQIIVHHRDEIIVCGNVVVKRSMDSRTSIMLYTLKG